VSLLMTMPGYYIICACPDRGPVPVLGWQGMARGKTPLPVTPFGVIQLSHLRHCALLAPDGTVFCYETSMMYASQREYENDKIRESVERLSGHIEDTVLI